MNSMQELANRIIRLEREVRSTATTPQLAYSSIEDAGSIGSNDADGTTMAQFGGQFDGSFGAMSLNGPTPPTPSAPVVTPAVGGLTVQWDGLFTDATFAPMDFARVEVHVSTDPAFVPDMATTLFATIESPRGASPFIALADGAYYAAFVARSLSGKAGAASVTTGPVSPLVIAAGSAIFAQGTAPSSVGRTNGDMWIDTSDGNATYIWDGAWTARLVGGAALAFDAIDGKTITGATILTGASGTTHWEMSSVTADEILGYTGDPTETAPGNIRVAADGTYLLTHIYSPHNASGQYAYILAGAALGGGTAAWLGADTTYISGNVNVTGDLFVGGQSVSTSATAKSRLTSLSVPNAAWTNVTTWATFVTHTGGTVGQASGVKVPVAGTYAVGGVATWPGNATGRRGTSITVNGTQDPSLLTTVAAGVASAIRTTTPPGFVVCAANDVISLMNYQDSDLLG